MKKPNRMEKIYLDMDGVVSDFDRRFIEVFGHSANEVKGTFTKSNLWEEFVTEGHFETLDWYPGGEVLLQYLREFNVPIEILSSSGGEEYYELIAEQKTKWLRDNNIHFPVNIVPGKRYKKNYATSCSVLIDDTERNIVEFIECGGFAIHHRDAETTMAILEYMK